MKWIINFFQELSSAVYLWRLSIYFHPHNLKKSFISYFQHRPRGFTAYTSPLLAGIWGGTGNQAFSHYSIAATFEDKMAITAWSDHCFLFSQMNGVLTGNHCLLTEDSKYMQNRIRVYDKVSSTESKSRI